MTDFRKARGSINAVLNGLVQDGIITGFRTDFGPENKASTPVIIITAPEGQEPDAVRVRVEDALIEVAIGINVVVERA